MKYFDAFAGSSGVSRLEKLGEFIRAADFDFPPELLGEIRSIKRFLTA